MTEPVPILVPQEVVNDTSVRVVSLACASGQEVKEGQSVAELETSKSNLQVEAPSAGWLQLLCKIGDDVPVGGVLGRLYISKAECQAALQASSAPVLAPSPAEEEPTASAVTVFSEGARALMKAKGLDEALFKGQSFVRAADVQALLRDDLPPAATLPTAEAAPVKTPAPAKEAIPFQQTLDEAWPLWPLIRADLHRINGLHDNAELLRQWWWNPGFCYVLWYRIGRWARLRPWAKLLIYPLAILILHRRHLQSGIRIPLSVKAGPGLLIGHWGSIWINPACTLGANCTLGNDINFGSAGGAGKIGVPHLGDNVFVGPGARVAGPVKVGQNVAIMPNTLVTTDVAPGSIVVGVPHKVSGHQDHNIFVSQTHYPLP